MLGQAKQADNSLCRQLPARGELKFAWDCIKVWKGEWVGSPTRDSPAAEVSHWLYLSYIAPARPNREAPQPCRSIDHCIDLLCWAVHMRIHWEI